MGNNHLNGDGYKRLLAAVILDALKCTRSSNGLREPALEWLRGETCKEYMDFLDLNYSIEKAIVIVTSSQLRLTKRNFFITEKGKQNDRII